MLDALTGFWDVYRYEIVVTLGIVVGALIIVWLIRRSVTKWQQGIVEPLAGSDDQHERERAQRLITLSNVGKALAVLAVLVIVVLTIMAVWGIPMTPFVAVGATVGVAVGLGAQDVVRDIIAGFLILLEDQYSIGDVVEIAGVSGTVESINLRTTVLRDLDGLVHYVPNGQIQVASNFTSAFARYVADVPVSYDSDVDTAMDVIHRTAITMAEEPSWESVFYEKPEMLGVNDLGDSAVVIRVMLTVATEQRWTAKREFLRRVKLSLDDAGIEIPYAYMNVVMRDEG